MAKYRWVLTGCPIENCVTDLHSIFEFLNPLVLGSYGNFKERYLVTELRNFNGRMFDQVTGHKNLSELKEVIKPYYLRRTKGEVLDELPEVVSERIWVDLSKSERKSYSQLEDIVVEKKRRDESFMGEIQLLRVLSNGEVNLKWSSTTNPQAQKIAFDAGWGSAKNDECEKLLEQIFQVNDKVVVFSDFVNPLVDLKKRFAKKGWKYALLTGDSKKELELDKFEHDRECKVLLSQTKTGGYGLNLQFCSNIVFLNLPWNPAVRDQCIGRCHRIGQNQTVFIYELVASETIEEKVLDILDSKEAVSQAVITKNFKKFVGGDKNGR